MGKIRVMIIWGLCGISGFFCSLNAQYVHSEKPLLLVIQEIEAQTEYRFLYRSAQISDLKVTVSATESSFFDELNSLLSSFNLRLIVQQERNQIVIVRSEVKTPSKKTFTFKGQVVDNTTGERLPYATITWRENGTLKGVASNESGVFSIKRDLVQDSVTISCSYFGYYPEDVVLNISKNSSIEDFTFRLQRDRIDVNQLVVIGTNLYSDISAKNSTVLDIGNFSPIGEASTVSALQTLPSVSLSTLMDGELQVRGSPADGFRVLVDDITVYNHSHLYGLIDSFNGDVLQRSGFYYDIAPAKIQAPPGGTLSLITKSGSMDEFSGSAGVSNSAVRFSAEGPLKKGNISWLLSARKSYLNTVNWFNNRNLVRWGLNVDRTKSDLEPGIVNLETFLVRPEDTDASFYDVHGKIYVEGKSGNRLVLSGYLGGDFTEYSKERLYRTISNSQSPEFEFRPVSSENNWRNSAVSLKYNHWMNSDIYSSSIAGLSVYSTTFSQDDFVYIKSGNGNQNLNAFVFPFGNESVLNDFNIQQMFEFQTRENLFWTAGLSYNYYLGEYAENSFDRPGYFRSVRSHKVDLFSQIDYSGFDENLDVFLGSRIHYYSSGDYIRFSPRLKFTLFPKSNLSFAAGFSRNHQFLNQISLTNTITSDVWVLADENQKPTSLNYYSTGIYYSVVKPLFIQVEAYLKEFENVRLHEINTFSLSNTFASNPWFTNNDGAAKGLEFLVNLDFKKVQFSQTYALSEIVLSNPLINDGDDFFADWDRTSKYSSVLSARPHAFFSAHVAWHFATGTPNTLATFGPQINDRLKNYTRTDLTVEYKRTFDSFGFNISASLFNVFNTQNVWYRDLSIVLDQNSSPEQITTAPVDVYDVGIQPSFNISVDF